MLDERRNPIDQRLTSGVIYNALDRAAARRVRAMLGGGMHWREAGRWLVELSKEADVEAVLALVSRVEGGLDESPT